MGKLGSKIPSGSRLALMMEKYGKPGMLPAVLKQLLISVTFGILMRIQSFKIYEGFRRSTL